MNTYHSIAVETQIECATAHELTSMLFQGARNYLAAAEGNIIRNQTKEKGENISKVLGIIDELNNTLNYEAGGEIATNLHALYTYIQTILLKASVDNDVELLAEANILMSSIHESWKVIG